VNTDVLFLGTEQALFVSVDAGRCWTRFASNLPTTLYDDLAIHPRDDDLIVATHGRSIWILDDVGPLLEWSSEVAASEAHLFRVRPATIYQYWKATSYRGQAAFAGENPSEGALLSYYLRRPASGVAITIINGRGETVRRLNAPGSPGVIHRVNWDLRHEPPPFQPDTGRVEALPELPQPITPRGPFVTPGDYTVKLEAGGRSYSRMFEVIGDPLIKLADAEWREREEFLLALRDLQHRAWHTSQRADSLVRRVTAKRDSLGAAGDVSESLASSADSLNTVARRLRSLRQRVYRLASAFNGNGVRQGSLYPPTQTHLQQIRMLEEELRRETTVLQSHAAEESGGR
jgi:hypothetical protein